MDKQSAQGFSIIELVTVILLIGILATVVLPKFSSRDGFAEYAIRDQFISAFRFAQQRAMYDHGGPCYSIHIDNNGFGSNKDDVPFGPMAEIDFTAGDYAGFTIERDGSTAPSIYFDGLGNAYTDECSDTAPAVDDPLRLTIEPAGIDVEIYSTGFIRAI